MLQSGEIVRAEAVPGWAIRELTFPHRLAAIVAVPFRSLPWI